MYSGGPYEDDIDGTEVQVDLCLAEGCYIFEISDSYGDGLCCEYGEGAWTILDENGATVDSGGEFEDSDQTVFCTNVSDVREAYQADAPSAFPNPASSFVRLDAPDWTGSDLRAFDGAGKIMTTVRLTNSSTVLDVSNWSAGLYLLSVRHPIYGVHHQRLLVD